MKLSKKQRNTVYRVAYETLLKGDSYLCYSVCPILTDIAYDLYNGLMDGECPTPEFYLFEPRYVRNIYEWWDSDDLNSRLIALSFCIAMTEN